MSYDNSSFYGELVCDEYDEENNFMNTVTPTGFYVYKILGSALDMMQDMTTKFLNDISLISADPSSLDYFWGLSYGMPRPELPSGRLMDDDEYRAYLYLRNCQLITLQNILVNVEKAFGAADESINVVHEDLFLRTVDHMKYTSIEANGSNLQKQATDESPHYIIDHSHAGDTHVARFGGKLSEVESDQQVILIPQRGPEEHWDTEFLDYLTPYLSVKGDLVLREQGEA